MQKSLVFHRDKSEPYYFIEGCIIRELSNSPIDPLVSVAEATVAVNTTTRWHRLVDTWERYVILKGRGRVALGGDISELVGAGDTVVIPPNTPQRISNIGSEELVFLAICSPRFDREAYVDLEQTNNT